MPRQIDNEVIREAGELQATLAMQLCLERGIVPDVQQLRLAAYETWREYLGRPSSFSERHVFDEGFTRCWDDARCGYEASRARRAA